jgi:hypothetical protein
MFVLPPLLKEAKPQKLAQLRKRNHCVLNRAIRARYLNTLTSSAGKLTFRLRQKSMDLKHERTPHAACGG